MTLALAVRVQPRADQLSMVRSQLDEWLDREDVSDWTCFAVVTAVNEAVTNSIVHVGSLVPIELRVIKDGRQILATVVDHGRWRSRLKSSGVRGKGIEYMRALMDEVSIKTTKEGTIVTLAISSASDG